MILPLEATIGLQDKKNFQRKTTQGDTYSLQKPPAMEYFQCILAEIQLNKIFKITFHKVQSYFTQLNKKKISF